MDVVLVFGIVFALGSAGVIVGGALIVNRVVKKTVIERHEALEELVTTGDVPRVWKERYEARIEKLAARPNRAERAALLRSRERDHYVAKLEGLVRYLKTTRLVESEETRSELLDRLNRIRSEWSVST